VFERHCNTFNLSPLNLFETMVIHNEISWPKKKRAQESTTIIKGHSERYPKKNPHRISKTH